MATLSPLQQEVVDSLKQHGVLLRYDRGFWSAPNVEMRKLNCGMPYGEVLIPTWHFGTNTIKAMLRKGIVVVTKTKTGVRVEYPVEVKLAPSN